MEEWKQGLDVSIMNTPKLCTMHIPNYIPCIYHAYTIYRMQEPKVYSNIGQYAGYISIYSMDVKYRRPQDMDVNLLNERDL